MDRYDAILEQLKNAQSQGVDSVASRLEAVVANLDELLQTAKATVQSALSAEAGETFPIGDVEALVAKMREESLDREEQEIRSAIDEMIDKRVLTELGPPPTKKNRSPGTADLWQEELDAELAAATQQVLELHQTHGPNELQQKEAEARDEGQRVRGQRGGS